jgi:hypothetical protein
LAGLGHGGTFSSVTYVYICTVFQDECSGRGGRKQEKIWDGRSMEGGLEPRIHRKISEFIRIL